MARTKSSPVVLTGAKICRHKPRQVRRKKHLLFKDTMLPLECGIPALPTRGFRKATWNKSRQTPLHPVLLKLTQPTFFTHRSLVTNDRLFPHAHFTQVGKVVTPIIFPANTIVTPLSGAVNITNSTHLTNIDKGEQKFKNILR